MGAGGTIGWRTCEASGTGLPIGCSGRGGPPEGEFAYRSRDGVPENGGAVAAGMLESPFAGRKSTSDNPMVLRKAGAVLVAF
jgi:hypothetical protein